MGLGFPPSELGSSHAIDLEGAGMATWQLRDAVRSVEGLGFAISRWGPEKVFLSKEGK
jgi:hypothetical protein